MGKHRISNVTSFAPILLLLLVASVWARPTTPREAQLAVAGWLAGNAQPFDTRLGTEVADVETVAGAAGEPLYYVVRLHPSGLVTVPADDLVEPILSFTAGRTDEPSAQDPLTALVTADVSRRLTEAYASGAPGRLQALSATETQAKWSDLIDRARLPRNDLGILSLQTVSDVRVAPFLQTRWAQGDVCSAPCYNYFTPDHHPCGCAATAMAQLMYYWHCPTTGIGQHSFTVSVLGNERSASTRGGDGAGGPYQWADMVPVADCNLTVAQRTAIGALCYDAGVAVHMDYAPEGSGADGFALAVALRNTFGFSNGITGASHGRDIGGGLAGMISPNLDAEYPVILGILGKTGHAALADGYGYDTSTNTKTLYHHLNMGWGGREDLWYNLPDVGKYDSVLVCIYNIFRAGTGEIVSGRVIDTAGQPIPDVTVRADLPPQRYETTTNGRGIYALTQLPPASSFTLEATKSGFTFAKQTVVTGTSRDYQASAGNRWAIDFIGNHTADSTLPDANTPGLPMGLGIAE